MWKGSPHTASGQGQDGKRSACEGREGLVRAGARVGEAALLKNDVASRVLGVASSDIPSSTTGRLNMRRIATPVILHHFETLGAYRTSDPPRLRDDGSVLGWVGGQGNHPSLPSLPFPFPGSPERRAVADATLLRMRVSRTLCSNPCPLSNCAVPKGNGDIFLLQVV